MNSKLLLILGGGALLYFFFESQSSTAAATTTTGTGTGTGTNAGTGTSTTGGTTAPPASSTPAPGSLAAIYAAMVKAALPDTGFVSHDGDLWGLPYHWNFYLTQVAPHAPAGTSGTWPPDPATVFSGVDLNAMMSSTQFWAGMAPYLHSNFGMSGLGGGVRFNNFGGWAA